MPDPTISLGLDHILSGPDPVDALTGALGLDINALRTRAATRRKAQAEQHQARMDLVWAEWQTAGQARLQAVRIVSLEERAQLLSASHLSARSLFESYRAAAARGDVAADQLQTARLAEADAFQSEQLAEKDLAAARLELNRLLGLRPEAELRLAPLTMTDPSINAAKLFEIARAGRSDLRALREGYAAQEAALRKAVLDQFPTLDLTINGGRDTGKNITVGPAVGFTLPLWNRNRGGIAIEKATREALKSEYEARLFQTRADIASAVSGLNRARAQYRDQKAGLGSAQARAVSSRSAASRGDISRATAEVAEQTLRDRTAMVVQSAQDVAEQTIALELLTGVSREQWQ
jgi:outer membrane protein TolC